ncbi:glucoside xylosyltransferase 1 isoform X1 [Vanessa atalanta]|uniref:glucoside xylosyltransferase 1 isoform X1 n=1 Tax=Vanessa atalanta TaxID=42275 RepID=UPI001FCD4C66|nr:glucoside xylosyltransferase 1 isoform X1 [Vanessa atalanta]
MRRLPLLKLFILIFLCVTVLYIYSASNRSKNNTELVKSGHIIDSNQEKPFIDRIVISFVVCDSRFNESLNVIKSVLLFTKTPVYFVIFTDNKLRSQFNETLHKWKPMFDNQLDFELQRIKFPEAHEEDWMNLFSKCAAQRLFIPKLLPHIDSMIYVDTDTLFLGPADDLWKTFKKFNNSQISAMTLEDDNPNVSWYPRFAKHPFYGKYGLNSGVMLMNLTRMREFGWVDYVTPIMLKWKLYIPWGDQDIINIIFHYHERAVYIMSCRYNYRSDQCMYGDACADATEHGVFVLHGSRKAFHNHKQPAFEAIYRAVDEYEIGTEPMKILENIDKYLMDAPQSHCGNLKDAFLKIPLQTLIKKHSRPDR